MREKMFMVLWGLTLISMGLAIYLLLEIKPMLQADHEILDAIVKLHLVAK